MRDFPIDSLITGYENKLRAIRETFSPAVKLVESDDYWNIPTTAAKLGERMPAIILTLDDGEMDRPRPSGAEDPLQSRVTVKANYLYPLDTANRGQMRLAIQKIVEAFCASEDFDDVPEVTAALAGYPNVGLAEIIPGGMRAVDRLIEINIGWAEVDLTAILISNNH